MTPDTELEVKFIKAQNVLHQVSRSIAFLGMWPEEITSSSRIRLAMYLTYHIFRVLMELIEFAMVLGNLQLTIDNVTNTGFQVAVILRLTSWRFNPKMRYAIEKFNEFHQRHEFQNTRELDVFIRYSEYSLAVYKIIRTTSVACVVSWYLTPFQNYLFAKLQNETFVFVYPFRMPPFEIFSRLDVAFLVHFTDIGMAYVSICFALTYGLYFTIIHHICGQLVIMSDRVRNLRVDPTVSMAEVFRPIIEKHTAIIRVSKALDDCSNVFLLYELLNTIIVIGLLAYYLIVDGDASSAVIVNYSLATINILVLIFANCFMGQCLENESMNLLEAFYDYQWHDMPLSYQRGLLICMLCARSPLKMTAGKFYKFSLEGFTIILKSSMAVISMLRKTV
ncbi:uncharacterized protein LOC107041505 [Diachasma alloeum]|uniref:Odorant receptor n=1 Tax=Diachasma alloeum TaxID=454923 RepID=A0A4E0S4J0_9HYME|nr:uncharacterized protein LOC107041505 [Diachasma alloeum]THK33113.1 odorant receptor 192 [Diachasma alloeum]